MIYDEGCVFCGMLLSTFVGDFLATQIWTERMVSIGENVNVRRISTLSDPSGTDNSFLMNQGKKHIVVTILLFANAP